VKAKNWGKSCTLPPDPHNVKPETPNPEPAAVTQEAHTVWLTEVRKTYL
jgi:hypothetical protein